jgi:hypothetical protein
VDLHGGRAGCLRNLRGLPGSRILCRANVGQGPVHHPEQPVGVELEAARTEFQGLAAHQSGQTVRQLVGARHARAVDQNRDDADLTTQGSLDLQPDKILRVIDAPPAITVTDVEPLITDEREQDVARPDRSGYHLDEVVAQLDGVDVLEDLARTEAFGQPFIQPARWVCRLLPTVTDEDPT